MLVRRRHWHREARRRAGSNSASVTVACPAGGPDTQTGRAHSGRAGAGRRANLKPPATQSHCQAQAHCRPVSALALSAAAGSHAGRAVSVAAAAAAAARPLPVTVLGMPVVASALDR